MFCFIFSLLNGSQMYVFKNSKIQNYVKKFEKKITKYH